MWSPSILRNIIMSGRSGLRGLSGSVRQRVTTSKGAIQVVEV